MWFIDAFKNILNIKLSPDDRIKFMKYHNFTELIQYFVWRRAMMYVVIILTLAKLGWDSHTYIIDIINVANGNGISDANEIAFQIIRFSSKLFTIILQLIGLLIAAYYYANWNKSRKWLLASFAIPYIYVFMQYLVPYRRIFANTIDGIGDSLSNQLLDKISFDDDYVAERIHQILSQIFSSSFMQEFIEIVFDMTMIADCIKDLAPASISFIPALMRGAIVIKRLFVSSQELTWIIRATPIFLLPLISFIFIMLVQITGSWYLFGACISIIIAILLPTIAFQDAMNDRQSFEGSLLVTSIVRIIGAISMFLMIGLYLHFTNDMVTQYIINVNIETILHFILSFMIKYNCLTIIIADHILILISLLYHSNNYDVRTSIDEKIRIINDEETRVIDDVPLYNTGITYPEESFNLL